MSLKPYWLAATLLPGIGVQTIFQLLKIFPDIKSVFDASIKELTSIGLEPAQAEQIKNVNWTRVEQALRWSEQPGHHILAYDEETYPPLLREISDPPLVLYLKGNIDAISLPQLAIVGSRQATPGGIHLAKHFAYCLAQHHLAITSGLALGIDAASHRGALAAQGITLAIFGTGMQTIYPAIHSPLAADILKNHGALITEYPLDTLPKAKNFPRRNRIISGLSRGVLVVEAAVKSGSLVTARLAAEQGREVFAIPGAIHNPLARGCHQLLRQGAKLVETAEDILEELKMWHTSPEPVTDNRAKVSQVTDLDEKHGDLLAQIGFTTTALDTLIAQSGLTPSEVSSILLSLELQGYIQTVSGGYKRVE